MESIYTENLSQRYISGITH